MEPTGTDATSSKPFRLPGEVFQKLFFHQREGLSWLWDLHCMGTGGILADDMGLGKTFQVLHAHLPFFRLHPLFLLIFVVFSCSMPFDYIKAWIFFLKKERDYTKARQKPITLLLLYTYLVISQLAFIL